MRRILRLSFALVMLSAAAGAQEDVVVYMDAHKPLELRGVQSGSLSSANCGITPGVDLKQAYLVQGTLAELVVKCRKFLTQFSIKTVNVTNLQTFRVEDLEEAANLTTPLSSAGAPVSKGALPKGVATSGNLPQRTAQQFLAEMLDPATKAGPIIELNSDWLVLAREAERVEAEDKSFRQIKSQLLGTAPAALETVPDPVPTAGTGPLQDRRSDAYANCASMAAKPSLNGAKGCLHSIYLLEYSDEFPPHQKYGNEPAFRDLVVADNDAVAMVNNLGVLLSTQIPSVANALNAFEGDLAQYRADLNVFAGNMQALEDARELFDKLSGYTKQIEIRARLAQSLNSSGTTTVDVAELNKLAEEYYAAAGGPQFHPPAGLCEMFANFKIDIPNLLHTSEHLDPGNNRPACDDVRSVADRAISLGISAAQHVGEYYAPEIRAAYDAVNVTIPSRINEINILQSQVLSRANEIYDNSSVETPLPIQFNLSGMGTNPVFTFDVYMVETFPRFMVPPLSAQAPAGANALPPPASANAATPAAAHGNGSGGPPDTSSGAIVSHGEVKVHDLYRATMVAAFGFSGVGETTFTSTTVDTGTASDGTTTCSSGAPCTKITVSRGANHSSALVGFSYHPFGYDAFPDAKQSFKHRWGIMGGLSVQNVNDYYAGLDLQIARAVQIMGGTNFYRQKALSPGYANGGIYPGTPTFDGAQHWTTGAFGGIGLNLSIFRKAFGWATGIGVSAPGKGN